MSLREKLNNNPAVATGGAAVVLVICLLIIWCTFSGGGSGSYEFVYYNSETKTIELIRSSGGNPIVTPLEGTQTFQAILVTCSECKEVKEGDTVESLKEKDMYIWYLMRDGDADSAAAEQFMDTMEIRLIDGTDWVNLSTAKGDKLMSSAYNSICGSGVVPQRCGAKPRD
ncbi:MAG: hypothetical protein AAGC44_07705 [Planctomycetota bacterium]